MSSSGDRNALLIGGALVVIGLVAWIAISGGKPKPNEFRQADEGVSYS